MYANDNRGYLPNGNPKGVWDDYAGANQIMVYFATTYIKSPGLFYCPSDIDEIPTKIETADQKLPNSARVSYDFYFLYWAPEFGPKLTQLKGQAPLTWDLECGEPQGQLKNHKRGGNVAFSDGHVDWQISKEWDKTNWPNPATKYFP
jgi:prepilin-type processing-associated H-X9-DG protein